MTRKKTPEERYEALVKRITDAAAKLGAALSDGSAKRAPLTQRYFDAAKGRQDDGTMEIDDNAVVSEGGDRGAYVQAWIWVSDEDAGIESCEKCGTQIDGDGESADGLCTDCKKEDKP